MQCIYCAGNFLDKGFSREHVLQAALGWDATISCVCKTCNDAFGHTIDAALTKALEPFRVHFDVRDREGSTPKPRVRLEDGHWAGKTVSYDRTGIVFPSPIIAKGEGRYVSIGPFDMKAFEEKISQRRGEGRLELAGMGRDQGKLNLGNPLRFLSDPSAMRAVFKIAFNYLAFRLEPTGQALLSSDFDAIRSFVVGNSKVHHDKFSVPVSSAQTEIPVHRIFAAFDVDDGVAHSMVSLFDIFTFYIVLSPERPPTSGAFGTVIDPVNRQAEHLSQSDELIRQHLRTCREVFTKAQESADKLNFYKICWLEDTVERLNQWLEKTGINLRLELENDQ